MSSTIIRIAEHFSCNDAFFMFSLIYSCFTVQESREEYDTCQQPVHNWLATSYTTMVILRLTHLLGVVLDATSISSTLLLSINQKGLALQVTAIFSWFVAFPFFLCTTIAGTIMVLEVQRFTPSCWPSQAHLVSALAWLIVSYTWLYVNARIGFHMCSIERRRRQATRDLAVVQDSDTRSRWGELSNQSDYLSGEGLTPQVIASLPHEVYASNRAGTNRCFHSGECSICISDFAIGDNVRQLPSCGHTFHRSCIDLWLLRCASCPLCKCSLREERCMV